MSRLFTFIAAILAVVAVAPAAASSATDNELRGQPTLTRLSDRSAELTFVTDQRVVRRDVRVKFSNHSTTRGVQADGRHGNDFRYTQDVRAVRDLRVGVKYTVRILIEGQAPIVRKVLLKEQG